MLRPEDEGFVPQAFITRYHDLTKFHGEDRVIPRITLTADMGEGAWKYSRKQFPVRLCFAMTINKAQGQSL